MCASQGLEPTHSFLQRKCISLSPPVPPPREARIAPTAPHLAQRCGKQIHT